MPRKRKTKESWAVRPTGTFILDTSTTLAWFFEDETSVYADAVQLSLKKQTALSPSIWLLEVGNALLAGERRKRTTETKSSEFLRLLTSLPIHVERRDTMQIWIDLLAVARRYNLTAYDAAYLELSLRARLPLASLDDRLLEAAKLAGVDRFEPPDE